MPFPQLERYKNKDREVASLLVALEAYLDEVLRRPPQDPQAFYKSPSHDISPRWVAKELKTNLARAQALLYMCYEAGIIRPRYDVYCPDNNLFIESYYSADQLPQLVECPHHEETTEHSTHEYLVELFFEFAPTVVSSELRMAG